ncbi:hypothetical protein PTH_0109 [Pelotomaculum thermopropionicum SI]|uniref:Uncharacterized protein n=1 Tax=Pelotomaculum thermopropionicum (strain DSM 13744 / JCM 10971 / SI) TaxID=370438 RepID=A5D628_PELTS|nr:hypothetical protein PTH_0109 [Pelotomaculum thermopropionicum SI]
MVKAISLFTPFLALRWLLQKLFDRTLPMSYRQVPFLVKI